MLKIGISACFFHPDPKRATFGKKTLLYYEQSMAHWVLKHGAYPILLPTISPYADVSKILDFVDGLILHGGADMAPSSYGETPLDPRWSGDAVRDQYEIALYREARRRGLPVLGICRGLQVINVAEGGSLYQDIPTQKPGSLKHRDAEIYDELFHQVQIEAGTCLAGVYGATRGTVNTVHHQAIKTLAPTLVAEAFCPNDEIIEAVRLKQTTWQGAKKDFVLGVQWHPEYTLNRSETLDEARLMQAFLNLINET
jgi:putative glutamine amidotransferase